MRQEFRELYDTMAVSHDVKDMQVFGNVHREMMEWMIQNKPDLAQEWLDKLEAIRWCNYLSPKEAEKIVAAMDPKAPWSRDVWRSAMESLGLPMEDAPHYNRCALWTEMNKMYSDFGDEIAGLLGRALTPSDRDIITACYRMALKTLRDRDGIYDIRAYFGL